jgi:hypothetical protein
LPPSKVLALRAVGEVCTSKVTLLEEEDGEVIAPLSTRTRAQVRRSAHLG